MTQWRDTILQEFTPQLSRLTLVADPDGLMTEEGVLKGIRERGFDLIPFEDPVAFRYAYESKYRSLWDQGQSTELVVALRTQSANLKLLPFDLFASGRQLRFSIGQIFPNLSYPVVETLDRADFDALFSAQQQHRPGPLGETNTKDFILRHVYAFAAEVISTPAALLRCLLAKHYRNRSMSKAFEQRFVELLRQHAAFTDWPLEQIVPDRDAFLRFLQERWPTFLTRLANSKGAGLREPSPKIPNAIPGPDALPLEDHDVRVYIDNLFAEGLLKPVAHESSDLLASDWVSIGIKTDPQADAIRRFEKVAELVSKSLPSPQARHQDWLDFAFRTAELDFTWHQIPTTRHLEIKVTHQNLDFEINARYQAWLKQNFGTLHNQPPAPPVMVHHIPRFLSRQLHTSRRIALVVLDGLAIAQWLALEDSLKSRQPKFSFRRGAAFAWIPTVTPISRQSIFAGKPPLLFPQSLLTTDKDATHWSVFWSNQNLADHEIFHALLTGDEDRAQIEEILPGTKARAVGLTVTTPDKIMHGMHLGTAGMFNQISQWGDEPFLSGLLHTLLESGCRTFITSDHGNIEARGCGSPAEGMLAETRGQRARIYNQESIRETIHHKFPDATAWDPVGLPTSCFPLLAPHRQAFTNRKSRIICHGGSSVAETIVPFIEVSLHA